MRITDDYQDYRFTSSIKGRHHLALRKRRVEKIREEEFGEELEEAMHQMWMIIFCCIALASAWFFVFRV